MTLQLPFEAQYFETRDVLDGVVFGRQWWVLVYDPLSREPYQLPLPGATPESAAQMADRAVRQLALEQNWAKRSSP